MSPHHPRTSHGLRYPEQSCSGTAESIFGTSEEVLAAEAAELEESAEDYYGDDDLSE